MDRQLVNEDEEYNKNLQLDNSLIAQAKKSATQTLLKGLGLLVAGAILTSISYNITQPGGGYFVSTGLFLAGVYYILKGIFYYLNPDLLLKKAGISRPVTEYAKEDLAVDDGNTDTYVEPWNNW